MAQTGATIQASQHNPPLEDIAAALTGSLPVAGNAPMVGPLRLSDGSSSLPALTFNSEPTLGFYRKSAGVMGVSGALDGVRYIGELIPWSRRSPMPLTVFPYGQTLSRTAYPDLWIVAQDEIANGSSFYNNGNGTTTFGIGDLRGRAIFGKDDMGGSAAGRIQSGVVSIGANVIGGNGGIQAQTILRPQLPNVSMGLAGTPATINVTSTSSIVVQAAIKAGTIGYQSGGNFSGALINDNPGSSTLTSQGDYTPAGSVSLNNGVPQQVMPIMPPTIICNFLLYTGA